MAPPPSSPVLSPSPPFLCISGIVDASLKLTDKLLAPRLTGGISLSRGIAYLSQEKEKAERPSIASAAPGGLWRRHRGSSMADGASETVTAGGAVAPAGPAQPWPAHALQKTVGSGKFSAEIAGE